MPTKVFIQVASLPGQKWQHLMQSMRADARENSPPDPGRPRKQLGFLCQRVQRGPSRLWWKHHKHLQTWERCRATRTDTKCIKSSSTNTEKHPAHGMQCADALLSPRRPWHWPASRHGCCHARGDAPAPPGPACRRRGWGVPVLLPAPPRFWFPFFLGLHSPARSILPILHSAGALSSRFS